MRTKIEYLRPRLIAVRQLVDKKRVADIGCDHGKLVEDLFRHNKITYAFVSDISRESVMKAVELLTMNNRGFDYGVGDGLSTLSVGNNIEQVIISGMGGLEIIKILENNHLKLEEFILQPQNNELKLKIWLNQNNYDIINDFIVKDRHIYYNVLKVKLGKTKKQKLFDLKFGKENFYGNRDFYDYIEYNYTKLNQKLLSIPKSKQKEIKKEIKLFKKALKKWGKNYENNVAISKTRHGVEENSKIN